ncbi:MAG TPA: hypothetical protein VGR32_10560 [Brevundimonas sp.]|jgi:hypothetical protein|uniref:hypothetical protein n=1 Tax=Brevundimonas sp. TaxID=1871086 RepID=UPI002DEF2108|nr:hypothetical protein [Brevundimonas sp.]
MTGPEMNASAFKKTGVLVAGAAVVALGGCRTALDAAESADPAESARIAEIVNANRTFPRWEDFPRAGTDGPTIDQVRAEVGALRADGAALQARIAATPPVDDPTGFEAEVRARVDAVPISPDTQRTREQIDAFARGLRERARAPAPIPRR